MKKLWFIIFIIFIAFAETSCSKYEEGPLISLKSKKNRLLGMWKVTEFKKDAEDLTQYYQDTCGCDLELKYDLVPPSYIEKGNWMDIVCVNNDWNYGNNPHAQKNWRLTKDNNYLSLQLGLNNDTSYRKGLYPLTYCPGYFSLWEILRLTNSDLWLRYDDLKNIYTIKFEKK